MAVQLDILSSEVKEFHPEATDEAIAAAVASAEAAVGAEVWALRASLLQHMVVLVQHMLTTIPADLLTAVVDNNHEALTASVGALEEGDLKTYLVARMALYLECDTTDVTHN